MRIFVFVVLGQYFYLKFGLLRRLMRWRSFRQLCNLVQYALAAKLYANLLGQPLHQYLGQLQRAYHDAQVARCHHTRDVG